MSIRVRFAPSPTGKLHLGSARTALFNFLFAKHHKGKFILRFEDTDLKRSSFEAEKDILAGLKWLGLEWDEPIYYQSKRIKIYQKYLDILKKRGFVYECFCTQEELAKERQAMLKSGCPPLYSGRCRDLAEKEKQKLRRKIKPAWRLNVLKLAENKKLPEVICFNDLLRGKISRNIKEIGDFVIEKSDNMPVFFFAGVIDDYLMKISHIIRGEDHISNTFNQVLLFKALDLNLPKFVHIPLILEEDRSKMSKRKGGKSRIYDLRKLGYLPEAVNNFLALLGWSPKDDREFLSKEDLIKSFDLKGIKKGGSIFDLEKLNYLNGLWIRHKSNKELLNDFLAWLKWLKAQGESYPLIEKAVAPIPPDGGSPFWGNGRSPFGRKAKYLLKSILVFQTRITVLRDFLAMDYLFEKPKYSPKLLVFKKSNLKSTILGLKEAEKALKNFKKRFTVENIFKLFNNIVSSKKLNNGDLFWPVRVALSGREGSPSPQELIWVLGKKESLKRINLALKTLSKK